MICTPLTAGTTAYGSLVLVSRTAGSLNEGSAQLAAVLAAHATVAIAGSEVRQQLSTALRSRDIIGQAKGILMERYGLTPDTAFALLARMSQDSNIKLRDVAEQLCRTGAPPGAPPGRQPAGTAARQKGNPARPPQTRQGKTDAHQGPS